MTLTDPISCTYKLLFFRTPFFSNGLMKHSLYYTINETSSYENTQKIGIILSHCNPWLCNNVCTYLCIGHWMCIAKYRLVFVVGTCEVCSGTRLPKRTLRIGHELSQEETVLHRLWPDYSGSGSERSGIGLRSGQVNS